jgi:hypothetical protein
MPFAWSQRDRLTPMRMIEISHGYPKFEIARWERPCIRGRVIGLKRDNQVEHDRYNRRRFPGRTGMWPVFRQGQKVSIRLKKRRLRHAMALGTKGRYRRGNA